MKIKVISCSNPSYWYHNEIGNIFTILKDNDVDDVDYYVKQDISGWYMIRKNDAKIINEEIKLLSRYDILRMNNEQ